MRASLSILQVDISGTPSYNVATKDKKCGSNDSLESPMSRCVTEKDVRGKMVLVCADCLQRKEQQKEQNQQKQLKQNPSISIDRPRRPKKSDETDTESRKASAKRLVSGTDRYTYLSDGQRASEVRLRQDVDLGEQQLVPVAFRDTEMVSNSQVCDTVSAQKLTEVLREESAQKVPDLQTVRDCLGEILALQAAVETSLSEINNKEAVVPDVSRKPEVKGTGQAVSSAVGMSLDVEKKSTYPEAVVVSTKEGKQPSIVSTLSPDRKAVDQKSFKPYGLGSPVIQITTDDQLSRASRKSDRQQGPGNTTVIVRSGDSLTTYSGSNLSLWLMLGNDSEPDRIIAKQNKKASHKSQRPPRGYELLTETKYRGSSSSNAPVDTERTSSGTNEMTKKRNEEDEAAAACLDRTPSSNANYDGLKGISCYAPISSADVKTTQTEGTFRPSGPSALSTMNTPYQSPAVQQRLTHPLNTPSISRQQLVAAAAALLSSNENLLDSSSSPNQTSISRQQLAAASAALLSSDETTADYSSTPNQTSISRQQLAAATAALLSLNETSAYSSSTPNQTSVSRQQLVAAAAELLSSNETSTDFSSSLNKTSISRQQLAAALLSSIETSTDSNSPPNAPHQSPAVQQRSTHPVNTPSISRQQLAAAAAVLLSSNETSADYSSTLNQKSISSKQLTAAAAALLSLNETAADSSSTPNQTSISRQQLAAAAAVLLSPNETSADSSSTPNQTETKKASRSTDNSYYRIMTSPNDFDIDDSLPITLTGPPSVIKTISSALSGIAKEYSAPDFKRSSRFEVVVPSACDPQQLAKPDAACSDRTTQAEANLSADAPCSADGTNCNRCTKSAVKVTSTEGGIKFHLHSGILRSSPSSGTNDDIELIRRLSEMGARNAVLLESEERKESPKPEDPVFTSSSRFCFISDETIRCLSGILESAMHLTAALKVLDASCPEQTVQPSEVTVTDTAKSTVYNEESSPSTSTVAGRNLRQVKIIKPMPLGRSTGGARTPDSATSGTKSCKGMNSRQSGAAFQNARIISDGIREYHRRMKANVEVTEETQKALKVVEEYYFPDPPPKGNTEGNVTTESDAINSVREQHAVESISQTGAAASIPSSDPSSPSPQDAAPKVRASTTMTTESAAVTCCPKTFLRQQDSLDLRRCDCQAHRNALPDEMHQDGSADEEVLPSEDATVEGPQQCLYSTDECAYTAPSGALSSKLRPSETDAAAGADGISSAVDGVSVKSTGYDLELLTELSMATTELEEITPVTSG